MHVYLVILGVVLAAAHPSATGHLVAASFALTFFTVACATLVLVFKARADYRVAPAAVVRYGWKEV